MFQDDNFVEAYVKGSGEKQMIPRAWLDNEVLGAPFEVTPSGREAARVADGPSSEWTLKQLQDHADTLGVDHTGLRSKAEVLDAIQAATDSSDQPGQGEITTITDTADGQKES